MLLCQLQAVCRHGAPQLGVTCMRARAGDFWHVRGTLPVNPLNRVLEEFREWRQPTLMLVGNHDQVWFASHACLAAIECMHAYL